jgi:RHS repeat-associated protein
LVSRGDTTYTYAPGGELSKRTTTTASSTATTTYSYDPGGALAAVTLPDGTSISYVLDGVSHRVGKKRNGTLAQGWLYRDGLRPIAELGPTGSVTAMFVYASQFRVPDQVIKGATGYRIVSDLQGSVRLVVNTTTGEIVQQLDYDTFGNVTRDTNPGFQPFGFAGGLYDPDTHLVHFGTRDYDAESGRWTAKDPIGFAGGDSNLYTYVGGDPVNRVDPAGNFWVVVGVALAGGVVSGVADALDPEPGNGVAFSFVRGFVSGTASTLMYEGVLAVTKDEASALVLSNATGDLVTQAFGRRPLDLTRLGQRTAAGVFTGGFMGEKLTNVAGKAGKWLTKGVFGKQNGALPALFKEQTLGALLKPNTWRLLYENSFTEAIGDATTNAVDRALGIDDNRSICESN